MLQMKTCLAKVLFLIRNQGLEIFLFPAPLLADSWQPFNQYCTHLWRGSIPVSFRHALRKSWFKSLEPSWFRSDQGRAYRSMDLVSIVHSSSHYKRQWTCISGRSFSRYWIRTYSLRLTVSLHLSILFKIWFETRARLPICCFLPYRTMRTTYGPKNRKLHSRETGREGKKISSISTSL
jgi:hypothetical protein